MRKLILVTLLVLSCVGCSTFSALLDQNGTSTSMQKALCNDAKLGILTWTVMQDDSTDPAAVVYWAKYKKGLDLVLQTYCLGE